MRQIWNDSPPHMPPLERKWGYLVIAGYEQMELKNTSLRDEFQVCDPAKAVALSAAPKLSNNLVFQVVHNEWNILVCDQSVNCFMLFYCLNTVSRFAVIFDAFNFSLWGITPIRF